MKDEQTAEEFLSDRLKKMGGSGDKESVAQLLKEAVLAQERHNDLGNIKKTLEVVSDAITKSVLEIAKTLVMRLILTIGAATVWFTIFLFNMRDTTRDLQKQMVDVNQTISNVTLQLQKTADVSQQNASAIREIIIRGNFEQTRKP